MLLSYLGAITSDDGGGVKAFSGLYLSVLFRRNAARQGWRAMGNLEYGSRLFLTFQLAHQRDHFATKKGHIFLEMQERQQQQIHTGMF